MRTCVAIVLACAVLGTATAVHTPKSDADIVAAFAADGFSVVRNVTFQGSRGFTARSHNTTLLSTGAHKLVHYVEGTAAEMGNLAGLLMEREAAEMTTTYIDHFIMSMVSFKLDEELTKSPKWSGLYADFVKLLGDFLVDVSNKHFARDLAAGTFPAELIDEMHGLVDGCKAANASTPVTWERVVTLNYGMDWLSASLFSGSLHNLLADYAVSAGADRTMMELVRSLEAGDLQHPAFCDAFAATGPATLSGDDSYFARDFQLATALVFQDVQTMVVFNPSDGRLPLIGALAPGMVGAMTAMNAAGTAMGVDTLRSAQATADTPGLNSLLLVRASVHASKNTRELADFVASAKRGCPFLYPASDAAGEGIVLETAAYNKSAVMPDALEHVTDAELRKALPTNEYVQAHSKPDYRHGVYVRHMNYTLPEEFLSYNPALFAKAGVAYSPSSATNVTGMFFDTYTAEDAVWKKLASSYFSPTRAPNHTIIVSNFAVTPQLRLTQMNFWSDLFPGDSMQFRYDSLNRLLRKNYGQFTFPMVKDTISFLSPAKLPGYWHDYLNASDPMSAKVEGIVCAADLKVKKLATKGGYWADGWLELTLPSYV